jgi:5-methylcytosine-specific restriction protein A
MTAGIIEKIQDRISQLVGMKFLVEKTTNRDGTVSSIDFRPEVPEYPSGFVFRFCIYSKRFAVHFVPDSYALPLIRDMEAKVNAREAFSRLARSITSKSVRIKFIVNNHEIQIQDTTKWGSDWRKMEITLEKYSEDFDQRKLQSFENAIIEYGSKFFSMVTTLMPTEEIEVNLPEDFMGLPEGAKTLIEVNKYERNPINRLNCISFFGLSCKVCNFNFEERYGSLGSDFIHVHHITPVSEIGEDYAIDPTKDLVPVCPNCHAMLHKRDPPLTVEQLKTILNEKHTAPQNG